MADLTLDQAEKGARLRITHFSATETQFRRKLLALGVIPGAELVVSRLAPLGDPIQIQLRGTSVSLRKQEAAILHVEVIE